MGRRASDYVATVPEDLQSELMDCCDVAHEIGGETLWCWRKPGHKGDRRHYDKEYGVWWELAAV